MVRVQQSLGSGCVLLHEVTATSSEGLEVDEQPALGVGRVEGVRALAVAYFSSRLRRREAGHASSYGGEGGGVHGL